MRCNTKRVLDIHRWASNASLPQPGCATAAAVVLGARVGTTHDVAAAIAFLLGPDAGFISGQTLNVDGGFYMH